jgi:hypothetical protein
VKEAKKGRVVGDFIRLFRDAVPCLCVNGNKEGRGKESTLYESLLIWRVPLRPLALVFVVQCAAAPALGPSVACRVKSLSVVRERQAYHFAQLDDGGPELLLGGLAVMVIVLCVRRNRQNALRGPMRVLTSVSSISIPTTATTDR